MNRPWFQPFLAEAIGTFGLIFFGAGSIIMNEYTGGGVGLVGIALAHGVVLAVVITATAHISGGHINPAVTIGVWIGLVLVFAVLAGGPLTGAALNPARAFGPALVGGYWTGHIVYWAGPILGGIVAAAIYSRLLMPRTDETEAATAGE